MTETVYIIVSHDEESSWYSPTGFRDKERAEKELEQLNELQKKINLVFDESSKFVLGFSQDMDAVDFLSKYEALMSEVLEKHGVSQEEWDNAQAYVQHSIRTIQVN